MSDAQIEVVPYDPRWPAAFEAERATLARVLGPWLVGPIEHVGSTAIPGMAAKAVIDIMAGVQDLEQSRAALWVLPRVGYHHAPHRPDVMHWLCKPAPSHRTHHLHLVPFGSVLWRERLAFRDYLRAHGAAASEYAELKVRLAALHRDDREAYTEAKGPFVRRIVSLALHTT